MTDTTLRVVGEDNGTEELLRKIAQSLENVDKNTQKATKSTEQHDKKAKGLKQTYTELKSGLDIVGMGLGKVQQLLGATVGKYLEQAEAVRTLSQFTGATATETSKLMEIFDDAGVSSDSLKTAMRTLADNGLTPNVETIAQLSDKYNALSTQTERVQFLTDTFGARGAELGKIFEKTGNQIRAAGENIANAMTEEDIETAESLRTSIDTLNDSWAALNNVIMREVLPGNAAALKGFVDLVSVITEVTEAEAKEQRRKEALTRASMALQTSYRAGMNGLAAYQKVMHDFEVQEYYAANQAKLLEQSQIELADPVKNNTVAFDQYNTAIKNVQTATENQAAAAKDAKDKNEQWLDSIDTGLTSTIDRVLEKIDFMKSGGLELQKQFEAAYDEFIKDPGDPEVEKKMEELIVRSIALDTNLGKITADEAAKNIADTLNVTLEEAYGLLTNLRADIGAPITIQIKYQYDPFAPPIDDYAPGQGPKNGTGTGNTGGGSGGGNGSGGGSGGGGGGGSGGGGNQPDNVNSAGFSSGGSGITIIVNPPAGSDVMAIAQAVKNILSQQAETNRRKGTY